MVFINTLTCVIFILFLTFFGFIYLSFCQLSLEQNNTKMYLNEDYTYISCYFLFNDYTNEKIMYIGCFKRH